MQKNMLILTGLYGKFGYTCERYTVMKKDTHPEYKQVSVTCVCGASFTTGSTLCEDIRLDICSSCHPFYTGKQKFVDAAGRVEKFQKKYGGDYFAKKK